MPGERVLLNGIKIYIEHDNLEHVKEWDAIKDIPAKIPLVMVHGWSADHFRNYPVYEHLKNNGWPVVCYDLRGHGWSQKGLLGNYKIDDCVQDLDAIYTDFLKGRFGYEQFNLYGHSMGARTVSRLAAKHPDIPLAVIMEDPVFIIPLTQEEITEHDQWARQMPAQIQRWKTLTEEERLQIAEEAGHSDWRDVDKLEWARSKTQVSPNVMSVGATMGTIAEDFPQIVCPVLILKADTDKQTRQKNEAAVARIPQGRIIHVKGAGHNVRRDNWANTIHNLDEFLATLIN